MQLVKYSITWMSPATLHTIGLLVEDASNGAFKEKSKQKRIKGSDDKNDKRSTSVSNPEEDAASTPLDAQARALLRTGAQAASILITVRPEVARKEGTVYTLVNMLLAALLKCLGTSEEVNMTLAGETGGGSRGSNTLKRIAFYNKTVIQETESEAEGGGGQGVELWALVYHLLCLLEACYIHHPQHTDEALTTLASPGSSGGAAGSDVPPRGHIALELIQELLLFPHAWVRAVSARVLVLYLNRRGTSRASLEAALTSTSHHNVNSNPKGEGGKKRGRSVQPKERHEALLVPNALYHTSRRLCVALNQPSLDTGLLGSISSGLVKVCRMMIENNDLNELKEAKQDSDDGDDGDDDEDNDDEEEEREEEEEVEGDGDEKEKQRDALSWTMQRLHIIGTASTPWPSILLLP